MRFEVFLRMFAPSIVRVAPGRAPPEKVKANAAPTRPGVRNAARGSRCGGSGRSRVPTLLVEVGGRRAREGLVRLEVFLAGGADHALRKTGSGRTAVPAGRVEPVPHELFVQGVGTVARLVRG